MEKTYEHIRIILKSYRICLYIGIKIFKFRHYGMFKIAINIIISISMHQNRQLCVLCLSIMSIIGIMLGDYRVLENIYHSLNTILK